MRPGPSPSFGQQEARAAGFQKYQYTYYTYIYIPAIGGQGFRDIGGPRRSKHGGREYGRQRRVASRGPPNEIRGWFILRRRRRTLAGVQWMPVAGGGRPCSSKSIDFMLAYNGGRRSASATQTKAHTALLRRRPRRNDAERSSDATQAVPNLQRLLHVFQRRNL